MKAIILQAFGGTENFTLTEVDKPQNPKFNVLIKIKAAAFNPIDYQMRQGATESKLLKSPILGRELAGIVVDNGSTNEFSVGDAVVAYVGNLGSNGTYAEYISVPVELVAKKPANLSFEEACAIPLVGLTAWQCFKRLTITKSSSVFIAGGAGGVGTMLIKLLLGHGLDHFYTTAGNPESKTHLLQLGVSAEKILDYNQSHFIQNLKNLSGSQSFDFCIDLVGGNLSEICSEILNINGIYADITHKATEQAKELLFDKGATVVHVSNYAYSLTGKAADLQYYGQNLTHLLTLIETGKITAPPIQVIGHLNTNTVQQAHALLENNQAKGFKLVMQIAD